MILVGKRVTVSHSSNPELVGLTGLVIEDGKETLRIRTDDEHEKLIIKSTITLTIEGHETRGENLRGTHAQRHKR